MKQTQGRTWSQVLVRLGIIAAALLLAFGSQAQHALAISSNIVISEFRVRGPNGGSDEFVELFNLSIAPVNIGGWKIKGSNSAGTTSIRVTITAGVTLNPGCHYLVTNSSTSGGPYSGPVPGNQTYATGITDDGGIAITQPDDTIVDQVGMSTGSAFKEGTPVANLGTANLNRSYERKPGGASGSTQDTDNNASDFQLISPSDPQNLSSGCTKPSGVGTATPATVAIGQSTLLKVTVTPAGNPTSTGLTVTGNLGAIGGSASQAFYDDGTHGDVTANDLVFSFLTTVPLGTTTGTKSLPFTVADAQARTMSGTISLNVVANLPVSVSCDGPIVNDVGNPDSATVTASDPDGRVVTIAITSIAPSPSAGSIFVTNLQPAPAVGGTASADVNVDASVPAGNYTVGITASNNDGIPQTGTCTLTVRQFQPLRIHDVQDAAHISPYNGVQVSVNGIVTAKKSDGFWIEDDLAHWDADDATSEGIFVFTSSPPTVNVGDAVNVRGTVQEFRPGGSSTGNVTTTEIGSPLITTESSGNPLPPPVLVGTGGRVPPNQKFEDDSTACGSGSGDVETCDTFDPPQDGLDFWESLEGMLIQFNNPVAVGPASFSIEIPIVGDMGANASLRTPRGGVIVQPGNFNPERVVLNNAINSSYLSKNVSVGDYVSGSVIGVLDYNFGNYFLETIAPVTFSSGGLLRETTTPQGTNQVAIGTFNVENLAPTDPASKFNNLAGLIVNNLRSPDVIGVEEVQDNSGATDDHVVDATTTWTMLINAITSAGGPTYQFRQINPVDDKDGGAPGGNIRQGFLFRTDRGLSFVDRPCGGCNLSMDPVSIVNTLSGPQLSWSPGRIDPQNAAWNDTPALGFKGSRKPIVGEFLFHSHHFFVVANHFASKGGDDPLMGRHQPPVEVTKPQRLAQAQVEHDFIKNIRDADANAEVVVVGDLNDFQFSDPVKTLTGESVGDVILDDLINTLTASERYSYDFEGNSETLDHILINNHLFNHRPFTEDVVHVNSEFFDQASDHEPQVATLLLNDPPTAGAGGPYSVNEGDSVIVTASGTDPEGDPLTYAWDLDNNGTFETPGQSVTFSAAGLDGPSTKTIKVQVTDNGGLTAVAPATVNVQNVPPSIVSVSNNGPINEGASANITVVATDPAGALDPLGYEFDCNNDGTYEIGPQANNVASCAFGDNGNYTVNVRVNDGDGGQATGSTVVVVNNVAPTVNTPSVAPEPSTEGAAVVASASFSDPGTNDGPFTCTVNYGDSSGDLAGTVSANLCTGPSHTYSTFGTYSVVVKVTDKDHATGTNTALHTVIYNFSGFFQPVDNLPNLNVVKAGSAIPVKFSLGGNKGLNIFASGYPKSELIACDSSAPLDNIEETLTAGSSSLSYDATTNQYIYVWKTDKTWAGTCRQLVIKLNDGTFHRANFSFTK